VVVCPASAQSQRQRKPTLSATHYLLVRRKRSLKRAPNEPDRGGRVGWAWSPLSVQELLTSMLSVARRSVVGRFSIEDTKCCRAYWRRARQRQVGDRRRHWTGKVREMQLSNTLGQAGKGSRKHGDSCLGETEQSRASDLDRRCWWDGRMDGWHVGIWLISISLA
jgi:hypothetical protein